MAPQPSDLGNRPASQPSKRAWAAITLLAASAGLITACGSGSARPDSAGPAPGSAGPAPGSAGPALVPGQSAQAQLAQANGRAGTPSRHLDAEILGAYFPATARQYAAGTQLSGRIFSLQTQITAACLARHGFTYPTVSTSAAATHIWDLSQFPNIAWMKQTGLMVPILNLTATRPPAVPPGKEQAYHADLNGCIALAGKPFSKLRADTQALASEWTVTFTKIQTSPRVQGTLRQFSSCVRQAGAPADYSQNFNRFAVWAAGQMTVPSTGVIQPGPDRHWGGVFARCAQNLAALYEKLQVAAQAQFFHRHYQQIHQLEEQVPQILASAEKLIKADSTG
jgi:hypothetical protein